MSRAAAAAISLNIELDAVHYRSGKIVLSGHSAKHSVDAALFLTALRAGCEQQDPYFSLDPDNGALWNQQGHEALDDLWSRIKVDFGPDLSIRRNDKPSSTLEIRTISATRDYAQIWREIAPRHPNLRSKLVFHPEWLRDTRFGEILYKADVLLKELSSGIPVLAPGRLRAASVSGYLAADTERAAKGLLTNPADQREPLRRWRGSRLWFDIAPAPASTLSVTGDAPPQSHGDPQLTSLLKTRGLIRTQSDTKPRAATIVRDKDIVDLSFVSPRMFVRIHDHSTGQDLSDNDQI